MHITSDQFETKLQCIQCALGQFTHTYVNKLSVGISEECLLGKLTCLRVILRMLVCYDTANLPELTITNNVLSGEDILLLYKTADNIIG